LMRRAVGKKKKKDLEEQHARFVPGAVARGIPEAAAEAIFADIEFFADYGFNKAHAAAYAVITLQTAYLKAHYPVEYMAALLSIERGNLEKVAQLIAECRRLGIEVRPPDVSYSGADFTVEPVTAPAPGQKASFLGAKDLAIRFGLGAIKNVGDGPASVIVQARGEPPFADIDDFLRRVDLRQVNKRGLEYLIRAGALDALGERAALLAAIDQMMAISQQVHHSREIGQRSLFDLGSALGQIGDARFVLPRDVPPLVEKKLLADEKELLGVYMSAHPLDVLSQYVDDRLTLLSDVDTSMENEQVQVAGVVNSLRAIATKKGDSMAFAQLEDSSGSLELVVFPRVYGEAKELLGDDALLFVRGKVDVRDDRPKLITESIEPYKLPENARKRQVGRKKARHLLVEIPLTTDEREAMDIVARVFVVLTENRGDTSFTFCLRDGHGRVEMAFPNLATSYSAQVEQQLITLIGRDHFSVEWA